MLYTSDIAIIRYLFDSNDGTSAEERERMLKFSEGNFIKIVNESEFTKTMDQKATSKEW